MPGRFEDRFDVVLPGIFEAGRKTALARVLHDRPCRLGIFNLPHAGWFPKKTGGHDMIDLPLIVDRGDCKVLIQSLFFLQGRIVLVAFHHVIIHHRKNISPTHKNSLTGSFFLQTASESEKNHEFNKKIVCEKEFVFSGRSNNFGGWGGAG